MPRDDERRIVSKYLLDVSPTGVQHSIEVTDDGFIAVEHTPTRIENEILDTCEKMRGLQQTARPGGNLQHAARIPINTYYGWRREWQEHRRRGGELTWPQFEVSKLNSRDNSKMRTGHKRGHFGMKL